MALVFRCSLCNYKIGLIAPASLYNLTIENPVVRRPPVSAFLQYLKTPKPSRNILTSNRNPDAFLGIY